MLYTGLRTIRWTSYPFVSGEPDIRIPYCNVGRPVNGRFAVITDIHGATGSQILFLNFCKRANVNEIVFLGDANRRGERTYELYERFVDFIRGNQKRSFIGIRGNHDFVPPKYFDYFAPREPETPAFIEQDNHIFVHDGAVVEDLFRYGKIETDTERPFIIWHGHSHQTTFAHRMKLIGSIEDPEVVHIGTNEYFKRFALLPGQQYWINPGMQSFDRGNEGFAGFSQFAVFDSDKNEATLIKLTVPAGKLSCLQDGSEPAFTDALDNFVRIPEHLR